MSQVDPLSHGARIILKPVRHGQAETKGEFRASKTEALEKAVFLCVEAWREKIGHGWMSKDMRASWEAFILSPSNVTVLTEFIATHHRENLADKIDVPAFLSQEYVDAHFKHSDTFAHQVHPLTDVPSQADLSENI